MHIRPATARDLPDCATVNAAAFADDILWAYMHPRRENYPDCFRNYVLLRIKKRYYAGQSLVVAISDERDAFWTGKPQIMGLACFTKDGEKVEKEPVPFFYSM